MNQKNYSRTVGVFGGSGFIGEAIIQRLLKSNYKIKVATRSPYLSKTLECMGTLGRSNFAKLTLNHPSQFQISSRTAMSALI